MRNSKTAPNALRQSELAAMQLTVADDLAVANAKPMAA